MFVDLNFKTYFSLIMYSDSNCFEFLFNCKEMFVFYSAIMLLNVLMYKLLRIHGKCALFICFMAIAEMC